MLKRKHKLSITRRCRLLGLSRSAAYTRPAAAPVRDLEQLRQIDELHLEFPFYGSRQLSNEFRRQGVTVNRKRMRRLMGLAGITALYPQRSTSRPAPGHKIYPYLLRELKIVRPNQVWASDITYIPMRKGFLYLTAVLDLHSRRVLSWQLSNTLDAGSCVDALEDALRLCGAPEIFNTDQGAQFTSAEFTSVLRNARVLISMDGKGCWRDNVFVERLWRSLKYEEVYLKAYDDVAAARDGIGKWIKFYNTRRGHQALKGRTPDEAYGLAAQQPLAA
jgi:putative transposase